jgi:glutathione S-transferase
MSDFTIYGIPGSPYVRAALLGFEEKGVPYRLAPLAFGEQKSPAHLARQPFGRIPAMDHGDFRLYETQAILRYLDRLFATPPLVPTDAQREARMNQVMGITDWYVMPDVSAGICFGRLIAPRFGWPVDEARIAASVPRASVCIDEIGRLLGEQAFMAGDAVSLADLMLAPHLALFSETDEAKPMFGRNPNLVEWVQRMNARPSMASTTWERLASLQHAA